MAVTLQVPDPATIGALSAEIAARHALSGDQVPQLAKSIYDALTQTYADLVALDAGVSASYPQKKTLTFAYNHAALTATSASPNGTAAMINIDTALPNNARILSYTVKLGTAFTGGGVTSVNVDVGTAGDTTAIANNVNIKNAAVDGQASALGLGKAPWKHFPSGGQLIATITPDGGHKLSQLTAGSGCTIDVLYTVLA